MSPSAKMGAELRKMGRAGRGPQGAWSAAGGGVSISDWRQEVWVGFLWLEREPSVMLPCEANHGGQAPRAASHQVTPTTEQNREGGDGCAGVGEQHVDTESSLLLFCFFLLID